MSNTGNIKCTVKAVINKQKTRVLFAQVDNNFADILFHLSTLSLGLVMQILLKNFGDEAPVIGSLRNLYKGFTKFHSNAVEKLHLKYINYPHNIYTTFYAFPSGESKYFACLPISYSSSTDYFWFLKFSSSIKCFIIRDEDFHIFADGKVSILESLNHVGVAVEDMDGAEATDVTIGVNEIMEFLVRLLFSHRPLSDVILDTAVNSKLAAIKPEAGTPLLHYEKDATSNAKTMSLKLTFQKSTNKLLFAQADQDFVNYLFSVLFIPLGRVQYLLGRVHSSSLLGSTWSTTLVTDLAACKIDTEAIVERGMYIITDDLTVTRLFFFSSLSLLYELKINLSDIEEIEFQIGSDELLSIRKASLTSTRVFTDGLINRGMKKRLTPKQEK